jgi:uncharacterized RmlC-like cupin family protein
MTEMRVIRPEERSRATASTPGMDRQVGVGAETVGAEGIWSAYVEVAPGVKSGAHHHGDVESAIYIIKGRARFRFGEHLEKAIEVKTGDFIFVPPLVVHQEMNLSDSEPIEMIVSRPKENVVVNVDIPEAKEV